MGKRKPVIKKTRSSNSGGVNIYVIGLSVLFVLCAVGGLYLAPSKPSSSPAPTPSAPTTKNIQNYSVDQLIQERQKARSDEERTKIDVLLFDRTHEKQAFPPHEITWMETENVRLQTRAAAILRSQGERERAKRIFQRLIDQAPLPAEISSVAFDQLSQIYREDSDWDQVSQVLEKAIEMRTEDTYLNRWYGYWLEAILSDGAYSSQEAQRVIRQCLRDFRNIPDVFPFHCYQQGGMQAMFDGQIAESVNYFFTLYRELLRDWMDVKGQPCEATFVPLPFDLPETAQYRDAAILDTKWRPDTRNLSVPPPAGGCLDQEWPWHLEQGSMEREKTYYTEDPFGSMRCYTPTEKRTVIYRLQDVTVEGPRQHISRRVNDKQCVYYTPSFPYLNSYAQPRYHNKETYRYEDLKVVELDNVLILHFLDHNYYHMSVEGMAKIATFLHHPMLKEIPDWKILSRPTRTSVELFQALDLIDRAVPYSDEYRYQVKNLYVVDYQFSDEIVAPLLSAQAGEANIHFEDFFVPPTEVLQLTRSWLAGVPLGNQAEPRDVVLFLHRSSGSRTIADPLSLYESLAYVSRLHGLNFFLHGMQEETLVEQIRLFRRSVVVIGIHGAGFSNIIHVAPGTAVIELPVHPTKLSVYNRMASALGLPYYSTPKTSFSHFHSVSHFTPLMVTETTDTLIQALHDLGYQS